MPFFFLQTKYSSGSFDAMVKNPQDRNAIMSEIVRKSGGKIHSFYYCFGHEFDVLAIVEAPSYLRLSAFLMNYASSTGYRGFTKIVPLLTPEEGVEAMKVAGELRQYYQAPKA